MADYRESRNTYRRRGSRGGGRGLGGRGERRNKQIHTFPPWAAKVIFGRNGIGREGRLKRICRGVWIEEGKVSVPVTTSKVVVDRVVAEVDRLVEMARANGRETAALLPFVRVPSPTGNGTVWKVIMQVSVSMRKFYLKIDPFRSKILPGEDRDAKIRQKAYLESRTALDFRSDPTPLETIAFADCCDRYVAILEATEDLAGQLEAARNLSVSDPDQEDIDTFGIVLVDVDLFSNISVGKGKNLYIDPHTGGLEIAPTSGDIVNRRLFKLADEAVTVLKDAQAMITYLGDPTHNVYTVDPETRCLLSSSSETLGLPVQLDPTYLSFDLEDVDQVESIHILTARHGIHLYADLNKNKVSALLSSTLGRDVDPSELVNHVNQ